MHGDCHQQMLRSMRMLWTASGRHCRTCHQAQHQVWSASSSGYNMWAMTIRRVSCLPTCQQLLQALQRRARHTSNHLSLTCASLWQQQDALTAAALQHCINLSLENSTNVSMVECLHLHRELLMMQAQHRVSRRGLGQAARHCRALGRPEQQKAGCQTLP